MDLLIATTHFIPHPEVGQHKTMVFVLAFFFILLFFVSFVLIFIFVVFAGFIEVWDFGVFQGFFLKRKKRTYSWGSREVGEI